MIESNSKTPPISLSLPLPRVRASGLGCRGGGNVVEEARRWCDVGDEINAGEGDVYDAEDVQPQQVLATPELPPRDEIETHRIDHWPYRSWCEHCVRAFGRERGHGHTDTKIAMISMDYAFVTAKGPIVEHGEDGWNDPDTLNILLVKDSKSGSVFAHAIIKKGVDDKRFAVDMAVRDVL